MTTDRASERREQRREQLLTAAAQLVTERGVDGLTMHAIAERVDCAVGTIYTYFPSKSALLAALMSDAVQLLLDTYRAASESWSTELRDTPADVAAAARVFAFTELFVSAQQLHPEEFRFLQMLITTPETLIEPGDVASVLPSSLSFLAEVHDLLDAAVRVGTIREPEGRDDPLRRTLRWTGALHGVLLVANVAHVSGLPDADAYDPSVLSTEVTADLLSAWGASPEVVADARSVAGGLRPNAAPSTKPSGAVSA